MMLRKLADNPISPRLYMPSRASSVVHARFATFADFYPFYLDQHRHPVCRRLHFIGTALVIAMLIAALVSQVWLLLLFVPVAGYGFAWAGHLWFEKNRPATFAHPWYSLAADFVLFRDILVQRIRF
jgi:hypothetical protein